MLLTTKDVADRLGVTEKTVRNYIRDGDLPHFKIGRKKRLIRVSEHDLNVFISRGAEHGAAAHY